MSLFVELYSDFQEEVKLYHPDAVFNAKVFMRYLTRAARDFQRKTKVMENKKEVYADNEFFLGGDILQIIEVTDSENNALLPMEYKQARHEIQMSAPDVQGLTEVFYADVNMVSWRRKINRSENVMQNDLGKIPPPTGDESWGQHTRIFTVAANRLVVYPETLNGVTDDFFNVYYYEDVIPFSANEEAWKQWFIGDEEFTLCFENTGFNAPLSQYEDTILSKAVSEFLKARLDKDQYYIRLKEYEKSVAFVIDNKPTLFRGGVAMYNLSPNSY